MRKTGRVTALFLTLLAAGAAPAQAPLPSFSAGDLPEARIERSSTYDGKALYGYIDGGAELYFEYGFRRAVVQDVVVNTQQIHLEIFEMGSSEAAAGIFSVSSHGCLKGGDLWDFTCSGRFSTQAARGRYFIRAANSAGTPEGAEASHAVANLVGQKIRDSLYIPPALFSDSLFREGQLRFTMACGSLGVQNGLDEWTSLAEKLEGYWLRVLVQESAGITNVIALLEIRPENREAFSPHEWNTSAPSGTRRFVIPHGPRRVVLFETNADAKTAEKYCEALRRYGTD
jgi:hypothetical protein